MVTEDDQLRYYTPPAARVLFKKGDEAASSSIVWRRNSLDGGAAPGQAAATVAHVFPQQLETQTLPGPQLALSVHCEGGHPPNWLTSRQPVPEPLPVIP